MLIKNNKAHAATFYYKVGGKIFHVKIPGYVTVEIPDLTSTSQIVSNTSDRRIRHIEDKFGYNFETTFEEPNDPDFPTFSIVSSTSSLGTIHPLGTSKIAQGESVTYTMTPSTLESFQLTAATTYPAYGIISPSGSSLNASGCCYLSAFVVDGASAISAITGNLSAATTYQFAHVFATHTIASTFYLAQNTLFTMTPTAAPEYRVSAHTTNEPCGTLSPSGSTVYTSNFYYLRSFLIDGSEKVSDVTGTTSGVTTYLLHPDTNHYINPIFSYVQDVPRFSMTPTATGYLITAHTTNPNYGSITPSGSSIGTLNYNYLSSLLIDSVEQISGITGNPTASTLYNLSIDKSYDFNPVFSQVQTIKNFTLAPTAAPGYTLSAWSTNQSLGAISPSGSTIYTSNFYYLSSLFVDAVQRIANVTGTTSANTTYDLAVTTNHDVNPTFSYSSDTKTFTITPTAAPGYLLNVHTTGTADGSITPSGSSVGTANYYYLSSFLLDSTEQISGITGTAPYSSTSTYDLTVSAAHKVNPVFTQFLDTKTFTLSSAATFLVSAVTLGNSGGTITPSGMSITADAYLRNFFVDGDDKVAQIPGTTYNLTVTGNNDVNPVFSRNNTTITMTPERYFAVTSFTLDGVSKIGDIVSNVYTGISTSGLVEVLFSEYVHWEEMDSSLNGRVYTIQFSGSDLYIGGAFYDTMMIVNMPNNIGKWNGTRFVNVGDSSSFGAQFGIVYSIAFSGTDVYAAVSDASSNYYVSKYDGASWTKLGGNFNNPVRAITFSGTALYAGGGFTANDATAMTGLSRWDGASWSEVGGGLLNISEGAQTVYCLAVSGTNLYVGGDFTTANGTTTSARGLVKWDGENWSEIGSGVTVGYTPKVICMELANDNIYVGGTFISVSGGTIGISGITKWDGVKWNAIGEGIAAEAQVSSIRVKGTDVYAGGYFTRVSGTTIPVNYLAKFDGSNWSGVGDGTGGFIENGAMAIYSNSLYVGGEFTTVSATTIAAKYLAKYRPI